MMYLKLCIHIVISTQKISSDFDEIILWEENFRMTENKMEKIHENNIFTRLNEDLTLKFLFVHIRILTAKYFQNLSRTNQNLRFVLFWSTLIYTYLAFLNFSPKFIITKTQRIIDQWSNFALTFSYWYMFKWISITEYLQFHEIYFFSHQNLH